ncbi:hypothetical protein PJO48_29695, partial [Mycobacterium kansasii]
FGTLGLRFWEVFGLEFHILGLNGLGFRIFRIKNMDFRLWELGIYDLVQVFSNFGDSGLEKLGIWEF